MRKRTIILASSSPRRKKILRLANIKFRAVKSNLKEDLLIKKSSKYTTEKLVKILALSKGVNVITQKKNKFKGDEIIVAFDTVVICKNKIITKPKNNTDALRKILFLSNKTHKVYTGIAIIDLKKKSTRVGYEMTKVRMKKISKKEALVYIKTKEPLDKAGAYAIQGKGGKFVESISGDYFNVVGLPLRKFLIMLPR